MIDKNLKIEEKLAAVCGLFCPSCALYIGSIDEPARLKALANQWGKTVEEVTCYGCRSDKRSFYCENLCKMYKCAKEKNVKFCSQCGDYPCNDLKEFQSQAPHRIELWDSLKCIKENGYEKWFKDMVKHYSCQECGTINSAYDVKCRKCGKTPGNEYNNMHKDVIIKFMESMKK